MGWNFSLHTLSLACLRISGTVIKGCYLLLKSVAGALSQLHRSCIATQKVCPEDSVNSSAVLSDSQGTSAMSL